MNLTLKAILPFDFDLSARIFSDSDEPTGGYGDGKFMQVLRTGDRLFLVTISSSGTIEEPELLVEIEPNGAVSSNNKRSIGEAVSSMFNLSLDLQPFYEYVRKDKVMAILTRALRGLKSPNTPTVFEALVSSIIEQQISLNVAFTLENNVIKAFGDKLRVDTRDYYAFPTPQKLASATTSQLRKCGLSARKGEYIRDASRLIVDGILDLEELENNADDKVIIEKLDKLRGIGVWTAELTMIRGMHRFGVMPADDLGLRRTIAHYYCKEKMISSTDARQIARRWGAWKGLAAFYLIVARMLHIETDY